MGRIGLILAGVTFSTGLSGAILHNVDVDRDGRRYQVFSRSHLAAPRELIFEILTDYDRFGRISSIYTEYGFLEPADDGTPIVFTTMEGCVWYFCRSLRRVERMQAEAPQFIRTEVLPEESDFRYAVAEWILERNGNGTDLTYSLEMEPDFWVPPLIGPWVLKQRLQAGGARTVSRIERLALEDLARVQ